MAKRLRRIRGLQTRFGTTGCGITHSSPCREDTARSRSHCERDLFSLKRGSGFCSHASVIKNRAIGILT